MKYSIELRRRPYEENVFDPYSPELELYFGRVIGAIGWPSKRPGGIVVLGEELPLHPAVTPPIYWLAEYESADLGRLLGKAVFFMNMLKVRTFVAGFDATTNAYYLHFNRKARENRTPAISTTTPPNWQKDGGICYHFNVLKDMLRPDSKRLNLDPESRLPGMLAELPASVSDLKESDFPLVTALAYAAETLQSQPYHHALNKGPAKCITEYDVLQ